MRRRSMAGMSARGLSVYRHDKLFGDLGGNDVRDHPRRRKTIKGQ